MFSCTTSADDGATWSALQRAATTPSDETAKVAFSGNYGEYQGLAVAAGVAHPVWTDSRQTATLSEEIYATALVDPAHPATVPAAVTPSPQVQARISTQTYLDAEDRYEIARANSAGVANIRIGRQLRACPVADRPVGDAGRWRDLWAFLLEKQLSIPAELAASREVAAVPLAAPALAPWAHGVATVAQQDAKMRTANLAVCSLGRAWKRAHWAPSFPAKYAVGLARKAGVRAPLLGASQLTQAIAALQTLGLAQDEAFRTQGLAASKFR
jgi:hypothetical protein